MQRKAITTALVLVVVGLLAGLAAVYRQYQRADADRQRESEQRRRLQEALQSEHRARRREQSESQGVSATERETHQTLAAAYLHAAQQRLSAGRRAGARIFAAASLLHNPNNPLSPYRAPNTGDPRSRDAMAGIAGAQSVLYDVAMREVLEHRRSFGKLGFRVWSVAFSPNGSLLAMAGDSQSIRLWHLLERRWLAPLEAPAMPVFALAFSPDGTRLAAAGNTGRVRIWELATQRVLGTLNAHTKMALCVRFSGDGRFFATGGMDGLIRIWSARTLRNKATFKHPNGAIWSVDFSPDSRLLASAGWEGMDARIRLWNLKDRRALVTFKEHNGPIWTVRFSPDGSLLASGGLDKTIRLWGVRHMKLLATLRHHRADVTSLAFTPDGRRLVSASIDRSITLWRVRNPKPIATLQAHQRHVWSVAFSRDGGLLASGSWDQSVRLWRVGSTHRPKLLRSPSPSPTLAAFLSSDGKVLVSRDAQNIFRRWNVATLGKLSERRIPFATRHALAVFPKSALVATPGPHHSALLWSLTGNARPKPLRDHPDSVTGLAFSPDGERLATASRDGTISLWKSRTAQRLGRIKGGRSPIAFSPDGKQLVAAGKNNAASFWNVVERSPTFALATHAAAIDVLSFSPDGRMLVVARDDRAITLWDLKRRKRLRRLVGHSDDVLSAQVSRNGRLVISTSRDKTVRIWRTTTGFELLRLHLEHAANRAELTPDGRFITVPTVEGVALYPLKTNLWRSDPRALLKSTEAAGGMILKGFQLEPAP